MYFTLTWTPLAGADRAQVKTDIEGLVDSMPFENRTAAGTDGLVANVRHGRGVGDVFDLETGLRNLATGRFTFVLTHAGKGNLILHSGELDDGALTKVVDY